MNGWAGIVSEPLDHPGADVGERLRPVHVTITIDYPIHNPKERHRGPKTYPREDIPVSRLFKLAVSHEVLDEPDGDLRLAVAVGRHLARRLRFEGFPVKHRDSDGDTRPGA